MTERNIQVGGGNPYPQEVREEVITQYVLGIPLQSPDLDALRAVYAYPSLDSCMRYIKQYHKLGHWDHKIATGNHEAEREVLGRANVHTHDMIDVDESGMKIEASNPHFGKTVSFHRCHIDGAYNRERKLNLILAVSADPVYDMEWHEHWEQEEGGTTLYRMYTFFERIMDQLAVDRPERSFCFTMDNLNVHHHPMLLDLITSRGHRYLFRAPYWSVDGPIEYVFNTIHTHLLMHFRTIEDLNALGTLLDAIIPQLNGFLKYFLNVGFPNN